MKHTHTYTILGTNARILGRSRRDTITRIHFTLHALHIETRMNHMYMMPWFSLMPCKIR
jgi:hypothetical protein